jgi:hypothetical protein
MKQPKLTFLIDDTREDSPLLVLYHVWLSEDGIYLGHVAIQSKRPLPSMIEIQQRVTSLTFSEPASSRLKTTIGINDPSQT